METQVNQLKLNVTNINSYLIKSNKELKKLRGDKGRLFTKLEKQRELREKETNLESKGLGIGSGFSKIAGAVSSPVKGIFDKILEFFGIIALSILVQKLPQIIAKLEEFFDSGFFKSLVGVLNTLANGVGFLIDLTLSVTAGEIQKLDTESKNLKKNVDGLSEEAKKLEAKKGEYKKIQKDLKVPMVPMAPGSMYPMMMPKPKGYSSGGTVSNDKPNDQQTKPAYTPAKSGVLRQSERNMNVGFGDYAKSVDSIAETVDRDEENLMAFAEMSRNFREWNSLVGVTTGRPSMPPGQNGSGGPNGGGPPPRMAMIPGNGKIRSGAVINDSYDPDGQHSGMDISLLDANGNNPRGMIIQNPFSELKITGSGYQFENGTGFGWYVTGNAIIQGKTYELLVGHLDNIAVNVGDVLNAGDSIGTQGMSGSTTGPHVTTHINDLSGGGDPWGVLNSVAESWKKGKIIQTDKTKKQNNGLLTTIPRNTKGLNTSNKGGNQSLFVYAVQPVEMMTYVPMPVPIEVPSLDSTPSKPKVPSGWRA